MIDNSVPTDPTNFVEEGVIVNYPGPARAIRAQRIRPPAEDIMNIVGKDGFHAFRLVINLEIVDAENREVTRFDPPIEIRVRFTPTDFKKAAAARKDLSLGFWDGKQWFRFTKKHFYHQESGTSPDAVAWGVVTISSWDDPTIAVGT